MNVVNDVILIDILIVFFIVIIDRVIRLQTPWQFCTRAPRLVFSHSWFEVFAELADHHCVGQVLVSNST